MRISTNLMQQLAQNSILEQQAKLSKTEQQIATGRQILSPADDPAGATRVLSLNQVRDMTSQYQTNINSARERLNLEENALSGVVNLLQRSHELALQGNNGTLDNQARRDLSFEVQELIKEALALANKRDSNGEYLFAGYQSHTKPFSRAGSTFSYAGDNGHKQLQIAEDRQIRASDSGTDVFRAIRNGNGTFVTSVNSANTGTGVIGEGSVTDSSSYVSDNYDITFPIATAANGTLSFNDANNNDNLTYTLRINGSNVYSVSESGSPVNTLSGLATEINNDTGTTGVRAIVDGGTLYLANDTPSASTISVEEQISGASDGDADTLTGYFGSALTGATTPSATLSYTSDTASSYVVEDSGGNVVSSGSYQPGDQLSFNGMQVEITGEPQTSDAFAIAPSTNQDVFTTLQNLADVLGTGYSDSASQAQFNNSINRVLADLDQAMGNILKVSAQVGSRLNALDNQAQINDDLVFTLERARSEIEDLDYAEAVSRMNTQLVSLQAAQQAFVKIQNLSLFNYL